MQPQSHVAPPRGPASMRQPDQVMSLDVNERHRTNMFLITEHTDSAHFPVFFWDSSMRFRRCFVDNLACTRHTASTAGNDPHALCPLYGHRFSRQSRHRAPCTRFPRYSIGGDAALSINLDNESQSAFESMWVSQGYAMSSLPRQLSIRSTVKIGKEKFVRGLLCVSSAATSRACG